MHDTRQFLLFMRPQKSHVSIFSNACDIQIFNDEILNCNCPIYNIMKEGY